MELDTSTDIAASRRQFLATCGKYAVVTPPTVALLLSASGRKYSVAASGGSGGSHGNNGFGNGGNDGVPGHSDFQDNTR